jgi:hypothetical protein
MAQVLVVRTKYDAATRITHRWSEQVIQLAKSGGHTVRVLSGPKATRMDFEAAVASRPDLICLYAHGDDDRVLAQQTGSSSENLLDSSNASATRGTIVCAVACSCGASLGQSLVHARARAFIGYNQPINSVGQQRSFWFERGANAAILALLCSPIAIGQVDCFQAWQWSRRVYRLGVDYYQFGPGGREADSWALAAWCGWAGNRLVLHGDNNAAL